MNITLWLKTAVMSKKCISGDSHENTVRKELHLRLMTSGVYTLVIQNMQSMSRELELHQGWVSLIITGVWEVLLKMEPKEGTACSRQKQQPVTQQG